MLFQVGGQGTRPTFFEMAAAQQLPSSLRAALTYSIGVIVLSISIYLYINFRVFFFKKILRSDYFHYFLVLITLMLMMKVLALRRPFLHKVLDYEDEFFALLTLVLETHSLRTTGDSYFILGVAFIYYLALLKIEIGGHRTSSVRPHGDALFLFQHRKA